MSSNLKDEAWFPVKEIWIFEESLWYGVLEQAKKDLLSCNRQIRESALGWFQNDDIFINSFCGICMTFDIDPRVVRASILKNLPKNLLRNLPKKLI